MTALHVESLEKRYRDREILKSVSLYLEKHEVVGLLGPNGAGKTTCFYSIIGLAKPDAGDILLGDESILSLPIDARARRGIGYLPQEASVFRKLTVAENILAVLELRKDLDRASRRDRLEALMEEFQVSHLRDSNGISLSGGERRRVEIARALANDPDFILLDEPFAGVDPISVIDIQKIIEQLRDRGIGVLITDHNVRETLTICTRAYILGEGRVICTGSPDEVLENQKVRDIYLGQEFTL
ncbi:MAG: LPS export ABC transporter ATP-binding protein [Pseudomonadota bacterium]